MHELVEAKFTQNSDLMDRLLNTKHHVLVETNPFCDIWSAGYVNEAQAWDYRAYNGINLLGLILTELCEACLPEQETLSSQEIYWSWPRIRQLHAERAQRKQPTCSTYRDIVIANKKPYDPEDISEKPREGTVWREAYDEVFRQLKI